MTTPRDIRLSPSQLAFKLACRDAVKAAGGQEFVASECGRVQSRVSDWCSPNTDTFMPVDVIARVEALGAGTPGHPHVTRALARAQGMAVLRQCQDEQSPGARSLGQWLASVAGESSDVIGALASGAVYPGQATEAIAAMDPAARAALAHELDQLIDVLAGLNAALGRADSS